MIYIGKGKKNSFQDQPNFLRDRTAKVAIGLHLAKYCLNFYRIFSKDIESIVDETRMTFSEYLYKYGFEDLTPLFSLANAVQV